MSARRIAVALAAAAVVLGTMLAAPAWGAGGSYDLAGDFSATANPAGAWSYGWSATRGSAFNLLTSESTIVGLDVWQAPPGFPLVPVVYDNPSGATIASSCCNPVPAHTVAVHPGVGGANAVVRWTAPVAGTYSVAATFTGRDQAGTTTDVAVLDNGVQLFAGNVVGYLAAQSFSATVTVQAGDTLDFTVGYGPNGSYWSDTTGVAVTIAQADRTPPTITATASPAPNANGWNNGDVTVSFACTDAGSGVDAAASSLADVVLTASGTAAGTCVDNAGNSASASYTARIDRTPPTVTFLGNQGSYGLLDTVAITCAASDAESGLATDPCAGFSIGGPAWTFGPAATLPVPGLVAVDDAGNASAPATTSFTVTASADGLCALTRQLLADPGRGTRHDDGHGDEGGRAHELCQAFRQLQRAGARGNAHEQAEQLREIDRALAQLVRKGRLTQAQADALAGWAATL